MLAGMSFDDAWKQQLWAVNQRLASADGGGNGGPAAAAFWSRNVPALPYLACDATLMPSGNVNQLVSRATASSGSRTYPHGVPRTRGTPWVSGMELVKEAEVGERG